MKKISELKKIFEDLAPERPLEIGLIIRKFSFSISEPLQNFLDSLSDYTLRFLLSLNVPVREKEVAHFLVVYDYTNGNLEAFSYTEPVKGLEEYKIPPSLVPVIYMSFIFHTDPPNLPDIDKFPEITKSDFDDYGKTSKLDLSILKNIELEFEYYGKLL
jgi:hypothetical protein